MTPFAFTCLLPVYDGDAAEHLEAALASIAVNTLQPARIIVCEDGPLRADLAAVIEAQARRLPILRHRNPGPCGLHHNLNAALPLVETDWIARADADDLNLPDRFQAQFDYIATHPGVDAVGGDIEEFFPDGRARTKSMPTHHAAIVRYAALRNPLNHPTVVLRTAAVRAAGGYPDIPRREDYGLWVNMIGQGALMANLSRTLVRMRLGEDFHQRRAAGDTLAVERALLELKLAAGLPPLRSWAAFLLRAFALGDARASGLAYSRLRPR